MAEDAVVEIAYNRKMLGRLMALYGILCVINLSMAIFLGGLTIYLALTRSWFSLLSLLVASAAGFTVPYFFGLVTTLGRGLLHSNAAIVVNRSGIIDNASGYIVGQIAWHEIQRMHPWTIEFQLLPNRFFKTPTFARHPGFVIVFKDKAYLERLPYTKSLWIRIDSVTGGGSWLFVPGRFLGVTPDELMRQINRFYTTQVRGY